MDYTEIFNAAIKFIVAVTITFVIPWIKQNVDVLKLEKARKWIKTGVECAEMIYKESGMGEQKLQYVAEFAARHNVKYDSEQIRALIEEAVFEMKLALE